MATVPGTLAELLVLGLVVAGLMWLLSPLRRWIRNGLERRLMRRRHGEVIEAKFRPGPNGPRS